MARTPVPVEGTIPVVTAEIISEEEANRRNDTQPGGGTFDYGERTAEILSDTDLDLARRLGLDIDTLEDPLQDLYDQPDEEEPPQDDEEEPDDSEFMSEAYDVQFVPPWSPVPTSVGKKWVQKHPDAQVDVVFPTVYEEDRTAKIKDLGTAQGLDYISHQRAADQAAKELGFERYDYAEEQDQIKVEAKSIPQPALGVADDIASAVVGLPVGPGGKITPKAAGKAPVGPGGGSTGPAGSVVGAPAPGMASETPDPPTRRAPVSGAGKSEFRHQQRSTSGL
jgi:hypothetical protein